MQDEENVMEEEQDSGETIRISNFSMVISILFVTLVVIFLFAKIMFD